MLLNVCYVHILLAALSIPRDGYERIRYVAIAILLRICNI